MQLKISTYLRIINHVHPSINNIFGVLPQKLQNMLHLRFVRQSPESNAVLPRPGGDYLLRRRCGLLLRWWRLRLRNYWRRGR